jgi:hypothetical protein
MNPLAAGCLIAFIGCLAAVVLTVLALPVLFGIVVGLGSVCNSHLKATGLDADGLPNGPVSADFVKSRPDASLIYPGATVIGGSSQNEVPCPMVRRSTASVGIDLATPDSELKVNAWYKDRLLSEGWRECDRPLASDTRRFHRGDREWYTVIWVHPADQAQQERSVTGHMFGVTYAIDPSGPINWADYCQLSSARP